MAGAPGVRNSARDREAFFAAAHDLLAEGGYPALTIAALCQRLEVTKGSFYHHFEDVPDFVAAYTQRWQEHFVGLFESFATEPDLRRRLEAMPNGSLACMSPTMQAMLAWARTNRAVAESVPVVFGSVGALSAGTFAVWAQDAETGAVLAPMILSMSLGLLSRPKRFPPENFLRWSAEFYRACGIGSGLLRVQGRTHLQVHSCRQLAPVTTSPDSFVLASSETAGAPDSWRNLGPGWGKRERYFAAAGELLAAHGSEGLTVAALGERLELTKGSFQHHFGALGEFIQELARTWVRAELARIDGCLGETNPWRRLELLHTDLLVVPSASEAAWRAWGQSNDVVGAAVRLADEHREKALAVTLGQIRGTSDERILAEMTLGLAVGLHMWQPPLDTTLIVRATIEWTRRMIGIDAEVRTDSGTPRLAFRAA